MSDSNKKKPARKRTQAGKTASVRTPLIRREVWAIIALFFSIVSFFSALKFEGFFIDWYSWLAGSLLGAGSQIMPFALLASGVMLLYKRRGKARLRVSCIMSMPVIFGAVRHLTLSAGPYEAGMAGVGALAAQGREMASGGLVSGALAIFMRAALSQTGAMVLFIVLFIVAVFVAVSVTPIELFAKIKGLIPVPEPDDGLTKATEKPQKPSRLGAKLKPARTAGIDVKLDGDEANTIKMTPDRAAAKESAVAPPGVPTPAEALRGKAKNASAQKTQLADDAAHEQLNLPWIIPSAEAAPGQHSQGAAQKDPTGPVLPSFEVTQAVIGAPAAAAAVCEPEPVHAEPDAPVEQIIQSSLEQPMTSAYLYPPINLLKPGSGRPPGMEESIQACALRLLDTLQSFGIEATVVDITCGPTVTRYELQLQRGTKFAKVTNLSDDIALALGAIGVRVSTIPDKNAVGIEVPNEKQELVTIRDILASQQFKNSTSKLSFAVGKDISGGIVVGDVARMPHMLIAGTTGSGKSVCVNSILISLLYKSTPEEVRLIMIDPKMVELGRYNGIPHLLVPVVTDPRKAAGALNWAVLEMMRRYKLFSDSGVRDLAGYNKQMQQTEQPNMPQIVIVVDELSDLMVAARAEVEESIIRIAQMARAAGMHLIIATQRPSADVITGLMKTNIPSRIAFVVAQAVDSRIILDMMGAEKLLGRGDMLYAPLGGGKPQRVQGCYVADKEVDDVVAFVKQSGQADYSDEVMTHMENRAENSSSGAGSAMSAGAGDADDELLDSAIEIVVESGQASVSMLQRRLKLGYARAARLVDIMEERQIVGPFEGAKPRAVLISRDDWKEMLARRS